MAARCHGEDCCGACPRCRNNGAATAPPTGAPTHRILDLITYLVTDALERACDGTGAAPAALTKDDVRELATRVAAEAVNETLAAALAELHRRRAVMAPMVRTGEIRGYFDACEELASDLLALKIPMDARGRILSGGCR